MKLSILFSILLALKQQTLVGVWHVCCFRPARELSMVLMWIYSLELF